MSLNSKLYLSFFVMVAITVAAGLVGWSSSRSISHSLENFVATELPIRNKITQLANTVEHISGTQRTLLNMSLSSARRSAYHKDLEKQNALIGSLCAEIGSLFGEHGRNIPDIAQLVPLWDKAKNGCIAWIKGGNELEKLFAGWESTTILNPDSLLSRLKGFRGDHFALASRLGKMMLDGGDDGPEVTASDAACAFGRWRVDFDSGREPFGSNPAMVNAMRAMVEPHRLFHLTANEIQRGIGEDPEKNRQGISAAYDKNLAAANKVIGLFEEMSAEAERSRAIYNRAQDYALSTLNDLQNALLANLDELIDASTVNLEKQSSAVIRDGRRAVQTVLCLTIGALVAGLVLVLLLRRTIRLTLVHVISDLSGDADLLSSQAESFTESSQRLLNGARNQESALVETGSALEGITSVTRKNVEGMENASRLMRENAEHVRDGESAIGRMSGAMDEINDSSEKIGRIIKTIEEIAFQTNLLALNAAVEAARAGESGKGFAVVAEEVRNLAQRSAQAARDTAQLIEITVHRIDAGSKLTGELKERFAKISSATRHVNQLVADISGSTTEQTHGIGQINAAVSQIGRVTQENSDVAGRVFDACGELNNQVDDIRNAVLMLGTVIGRRTCGAAAAKAAPAMQAAPWRMPLLPSPKP